MFSLLKRTFPLALVAGLLMMPQAVQAHDPRDIFEECVAKVRHDTHTCINTMEDRTVHCIRVIRELLDNGHVERARRVGHECIVHLETYSNRCIQEIRVTCRRCIHVLRDLGANELAERLGRICRNSVEQIEQAKRRFIHAILDEFDR